MARLVRKNADKKTKTISELFVYKIFEFTFVSIFADITLLKVRRIWQLVENRYEFKPNLLSL